jgi:UDP-glucose 4-epimerase
MASEPKSRIYNIGSGVGSTLRDFERALRRQIPDADIKIGPGLNFLGMPYPAHGIYDVSRARDELGFKPQYDVEAGVADYLQSLRGMKARAA